MENDTSDNAAIDGIVARALPGDGGRGGEDVSSTINWAAKTSFGRWTYKAGPGDRKRDIALLQIEIRRTAECELYKLK